MQTISLFPINQSAISELLVFWISFICKPIFVLISFIKNIFGYSKNWYVLEHIVIKKIAVKISGRQYYPM
jgi:hypothetical protein